MKLSLSRLIHVCTCLFIIWGVISFDIHHDVAGGHDASLLLLLVLVDSHWCSLQVCHAVSPFKVVMFCINFNAVLFVFVLALLVLLCLLLPLLFGFY
jgi:hypothetical protein